MTKELTPKQEMFCQEYLIDLNATQAAIRAGYSEKTAKEQGCQNLTKLNVQERIQELMNERSQKTEISAEYVLNGIKELTQRCVQEFKASEALKGYELLGKHLKLFTDKTELSGSVEVTRKLYDKSNDSE